MMQIWISGGGGGGGGGGGVLDLFCYVKYFLYPGPGKGIALLQIT